jgi:hypothetical protein
LIVVGWILLLGMVFGVDQQLVVLRISITDLLVRKRKKTVGIMMLMILFGYETHVVMSLMMVEKNQPQKRLLMEIQGQSW